MAHMGGAEPDTSRHEAMGSGPILFHYSINLGGETGRAMADLVCDSPGLMRPGPRRPGSCGMAGEHCMPLPLPAAGAAHGTGSSQWRAHGRKRRLATGPSSPATLLDGASHALGLSAEFGGFRDHCSLNGWEINQNNEKGRQNVRVGTTRRCRTLWPHLVPACGRGGGLMGGQQ
ncbi:hypothetical protein BC628DRAFT_111629 [Trametes gibbosa]|nr:hypothetical protein BC628DRAFT_111629 [Trametes gibbosa]